MADTIAGKVPKRRKYSDYQGTKGRGSWYASGNKQQDDYIKSNPKVAANIRMEGAALDRERDRVNRPHKPDMMGNAIDRLHDIADEVTGGLAKRNTRWQSEAKKRKYSVTGPYKNPPTYYKNP